MHYQITRNGQNYGPYTLEDLQRYLASGNVLPTDLCKSDEMARLAARLPGHRRRKRCARARTFHRLQLR